jgi:5'-methylthioadenosine phosphorylase
MSTDGAIGIIGGSGLYELEGLSAVRWKALRTPFGDPSDEYCVGEFEGRRVIFLPRHGRGHRLTPSELNFRANIWGLKSLGAEWVISISAVGSMKESIHPLDLVIPEQFIDATRRRVSSFFGDGIVAHVGMADPVCSVLADALEKAARGGATTVQRGGTYICIEGPQFSTKAESRIYRQWGVDVIGMTNVATAKEVLRRVIPTIVGPRTCGCAELLRDAVITQPAAFPMATRRRLDLLLGKYFPAQKGKKRRG